MGSVLATISVRPLVRFAPLAAALGALVLAVPSFAADQLVSQAGTDSSDCSVAPCATLEAALANAVSGDEIKIGAGKFIDPSGEAPALWIRDGSMEITISGGWNAGFSAQDESLITRLQGRKSNTTLSLIAGAEGGSGGAGGTLIANLNNLTFAKGKEGFVLNLATQYGAATVLTVNVNNVDFVKNKSIVGALAVEVADGVATVNISDCAFFKNQSSDGAALWAYNSNGQLEVTIDDSAFFKNKSSSKTPDRGNGGAIFVQGVSYFPAISATSISITDTTFVGNQASRHGGAIGIDDYDRAEIDVHLSSVSFYRNKAIGDGGAIYIEAEDTLGYSGVSTDIVNGIFSRNAAKAGGGAIAVVTKGIDGDASLDLRNSSMTRGKAAEAGGGILLDGDGTGGVVTATVLNTIAWGNESATGVGDDIAIAGSAAGGVTLVNVDAAAIAGSFTDGGGNVSVDPLFVNSKADLHLQTTSPLRDAGTCTGVPALDVDIDGDARPTGAGCDIGADELNP